MKSIPVLVLMIALLSLKCASAPLVLNLAIGIKLDLNPDVYKMLSKVIVLLSPLIFVWSLILPFPAMLNISSFSVVDSGDG